MRDFDLNLLPVFNMLMEERSVTRTGERLGRTQSAVSAALRRLRESFNDPLFVRTARGLEPTRKALALYENTTEIAELSEQCLRLERDFDPQSDHAQFVIGAPDRLSLPVMLPFLRHIRAEAPNIGLDLRTADRGRAADLVQSKVLDLALGSFDEVPAGLMHRHAFDEVLVAVFDPRHPLAGETGPIDLATLVTYDHLIVTSGGVQGAVFDRLLRDMGLTRTKRVAVSNFIITPDLLKDGELVGVFTKRVAEIFVARHGLIARALPDDLPPVSHGLVWHRRMDGDRAHEWLRERLLSVCVEGDGFQRPR